MTPTYILDGIWGGHTRWERLRRSVELAGNPGHIWRYDNSGMVSLEVLAAQLVEELQTIDKPFHLVGYSMGGLVIREAMRQATDLPLRRTALLHSPHGGSFVAGLLPLVACREMRPGSAFLRRLDDAPWSRPTLVTWCAADLMVLPGHSARWHRATRVIRSDVPMHAWPVLSSGIHRSVTSFLNETN
jgi:Alpha/beta hydrolase family